MNAAPDHGPTAAGLRTFVAPSMPAALKLVKQALGPDAVILGTRSLEPGGMRGLVGRKRVEVTAAAAGRAAPAPRLKAAPTEPRARTARAAPRAPTIPDLVHPLYIRLVQNEVADELAEQLVRRAATRGQSAEAALRECIAELVPAGPGIELVPGAPRRVAFVGTTGAGKTTTIAKLAARFALREGRKVALVTLDSRRLAAEGQLQRFAEIVGAPAVAVRAAADLPAAEAAMRGADVTLIDTPGLELRDAAARAELRVQLAALAVHEIHLVVPADLAAATHGRVGAAFSDLNISQVVLTRLDDAAGFGVILGIMQKLRWRLSYLSHGQSIPDDLIPACSHELAELIFPTRATGTSS